MGSDHSNKEIIFKLIEWNDNVSRHVEIAPKTDPTISGSEYWRKEVEKGNVRVFGIYVDGIHTASLLASVLEGDIGAEFVCLVIGSDDGHANIFDTLPALELFAKKYGCISMSFQTARAGFMHKAKKHGYGVTDVIMRKEIAA